MYRRQLPPLESFAPGLGILKHGHVQSGITGWDSAISCSQPQKPLPIACGQKILDCILCFQLGQCWHRAGEVWHLPLPLQGLSLPTCPACLTTQECVPAWHVLQNHKTFCGSSLLCGDRHAPAERCQASPGSCREKAQSKACSGTACPGDMSAGSCGDRGIRWQISAVMFFFPGKSSSIPTALGAPGL